MTNNGLPGVAFHLHTPFAGQNLNNNLIADNTISGNGADTEDARTPGPTGINVFTNAHAAPINGTVIVQNIIKNEQVDIAANTGTGGLVDAHLNNLLGKATGVDNLGTGTVNATVNWWGARKVRVRRDAPASSKRALPLPRGLQRRLRSPSSARTARADRGPALRRASFESRFARVAGALRRPAFSVMIGELNFAG